MALLSSPLCRWENWVLQALNNLHKFECLDWGGAGIWTQVVWPVHPAILTLLNIDGKVRFLLQVLEGGEMSSILTWGNRLWEIRGLSKLTCLESKNAELWARPMYVTSQILYSTFFSTMTWVFLCGVKWKDKRTEGRTLWFPNHMMLMLFFQTFTRWQNLIYSSLQFNYQP